MRMIEAISGGIRMSGLLFLLFETCTLIRYAGLRKPFLILSMQSFVR
jgi:hypothetical protein